jgi:hypothetical protein
MVGERLNNIALTYANDILCDGAGSQLHRMYGVYALSRRFQVSYYHSPLKKIGYQGIVALENNENSEVLLKRYNDLFYLASDIELPNKYTTKMLMLGDGQALAGLVAQARENKNNFLLVKMPFSAPFTDKHPEIFDCLKEISPFQKKASSTFRVAIHVRWGDLLINHTERLLPNEYYIKVANKVAQMLKQWEIPFVCELHTELPTKPFWVTSEHHGVKNRIEQYCLKESVMLTPEQYRISDFDVIPCLLPCVNKDPIETLEALATADLLIMSRSSFSYLAALFNQTGAVVYAPFWHPPIPGWLQFNPPILFIEQLEEYGEKWKSKWQSVHFTG